MRGTAPNLAAGPLAAGRPEAARVVWTPRSGAASATPAAPARSLLRPLFAVGLGAALILSGRGALGGVAITLGAAEALLPAAMERARQVVGRAATAVLLAAAYVALFVPMRLARRRDPLSLALDRAAPTYWSRRAPNPNDPGRSS